MKTRLINALPFLLLVTLVSCEKDKDNTPPKSKSELITSGTWRFSVATVGGANVSSSLQPCQTDNTMVFAIALTGTLDEGPAKCNTGDPQTVPFTWSFSSNETVLNVSATLFTGGSNVFTINSLTESQLILSQTVNVGGTPQNVMVTFVH